MARRIFAQLLRRIQAATSISAMARARSLRNPAYDFNDGPFPTASDSLLPSRLRTSPSPIQERNVKKTLTSLLVAAVAYAAAPVHAGTLEDVKARGNLLCSSTTVAGLSMPDDTGKRHGLKSMSPRAIAIAVFGDPEGDKIVVSIRPSASPRCSPARSTSCSTPTWTLSREGAGALTPGDLLRRPGRAGPQGTIASAKELDGGAISAPTRVPRPSSTWSISSAPTR